MAKGKAAAERAWLEKMFNGRYARLSNCDWKVCWYCDAPSSEFDHCPPLNEMKFIDWDKFLNDGCEAVLIPSCSACNAYLGHKRLWTKFERIAYLYERSRKQVSKIGWIWGVDEIEELGHGLRELMQSSSRKHKEAVAYAGRIERRIIEVSKEYGTRRAR